jgi:hypothetical protein
MGVTFFNSGFKSDPTELFPSIVLVIEGEKRFPPPNFNLTPKGPRVFWCKTTKNYPLLKKEPVILF